MHDTLRDLVQRRPDLTACVADLELAFSALRTGYATDGKVLVCGSPGTESLARSWSARLTGGGGGHRDVGGYWRARLGGPLADQLLGTLPTLPLTACGELSRVAAWAVAPDFGLAQLVWSLGRPADVLVALDPSGRWAPVGMALRTASRLDLITVAFSGALDGGAVDEAADISVHLPGDDDGALLCACSAALECLAAMLEQEYFP